MAFPSSKFLSLFVAVGIIIIIFTWFILMQIDNLSFTFDSFILTYCDTPHLDPGIKFGLYSIDKAISNFGQWFNLMQAELHDFSIVFIDEF